MIELKKGDKVVLREDLVEKIYLNRRSRSCRFVSRHMDRYKNISNPVILLSDYIHNAHGDYYIPVPTGANGDWCISDTMIDWERTKSLRTSVKDRIKNMTL